MQQAPEYVQKRYHLLTIKANDKAYITHTSDSLILSLVDYYEHGGDPVYLGEAYYYAGSTYRDLGDALPVPWATIRKPSMPCLAMRT